MRRTQKNIQKTSGFTIVELMIAIPVIIIVMVSVMGLLVTLLNDFSAQGARQNLNVATQTAIQQIESDVKLSSEFRVNIDTNSFNDAYGPDNTGGSWSFKGSSAAARTLILTTYATDANPLDDIRGPVYFNTEGCTGDQKYRNEVLSNTVIYFIRGDSLYRRVLTNISLNADASPRLETCNTPFQVQTCPAFPSVPAISATKDSKCVIDDTEVLRKVSNFSINYYTEANPNTPITNPYTTTVNPLVLNDTIAASIDITHGVEGSPLKNTTSIRVTRFN